MQEKKEKFKENHDLKRNKNMSFKAWTAEKGQNKVKIRCAYVIQIFTEDFSYPSSIAAEKIPFSPLRLT